MPRYEPRSFTGDRSQHSTADADGCFVRTCWAGTDEDDSGCCATSTAATAKPVSNPMLHPRTGAAWQSRISAKWNCSTVRGIQPIITLGPKHPSKMWNWTWMTPPSHPSQKVQNSRLGPACPFKGAMLKQFHELFHCKPSLPHQRSKGPFGRFSVVGNGEASVRWVGVSKNHVAAVLLIEFTSSFPECLDCVSPGNNR